MLEAGTQVGPYEIVSLLGSGGMGEVYRARDSRLARTVALKILPPDVAADIGRRQRFEQEARAASALNHPNILSVYDMGSQDGLAYIVTELIDGESLRDMVRRGPLPQSRAIEIGGQVADGLAAAHAANIVHRDLKPENIMVTRDGRAKILDFGLAKQVQARLPGSDETQFLTRTSPGAVLGTAGYMSPEQVRGEPVDPRSDIFSFGLVLHECLSGRATFERQTGAEMMTAILREDAPDLPESITPSLRQIVQHCLEKEVARRFHSANDLGFALRNVNASNSGSRSGSSMAEAAPLGKRRTRNWVWPAIAAALAATLAALAIPHFRELDPIELAGYRFIPFANDHEAETGGAWSPDGKSIAYLKTIDGIPQLMVRGLEAATAIQLTKSRTHVSSVFWSPDSAVVYCVNREGRGELWGISPSGGHAAKILEDLYTAGMSPDGKALAIWRTTQAGGATKSSLWISSPPGTEPRPYRPAPFEIPLESSGNSVHFSPDGKSILLVANGIEPQIWVVPFPESAGTPRRIFREINFNFVPRASWMPDSRHAVLSFSTGGAQPALWLADLKREKLRRLTASTATEEAPSLAPGRPSIGVHERHGRFRSHRTSAGWRGSAHAPRQQPQHVLPLLVARWRAVDLRDGPLWFQRDLVASRESRDRPADGYRQGFSSRRHYRPGPPCLLAGRQPFCIRTIFHRSAGDHLGGTHGGRRTHQDGQRIYGFAHLVSRRQFHRGPDASRPAVAARDHRSGREHVAPRDRRRSDVPHAHGVVPHGRVAGLRSTRGH